MDSGLVIGYHGCTARLVEDLLSGREPNLRPSTSEYDWLGAGIYCWENSYHRAYEWADQHTPVGEEPAVVGLLIKPGRCMDLLDSAEIDMLQQFADNIKILYQLVGIDLPRNKGLRHDYDCMLINRYHRYVRRSRGVGYDTVRAAFMEGARINEESHSDLFVRTHIQWAICNPACIVGYFRPVPVQTS